MPSIGPSGSPNTRRYSDEEKAQAVRLVRQLRAELGTDHGTVKRVATQLGYGIESVRAWGTDVAGNAVSGVQVYVRDGVIQTAFPVAVP